MAKRLINQNNIMRGSLHDLYIDHAGSEIIHLDKIRDGFVSVNEEVRQDVYEDVNGQEKITDFSRKVTLELVYDEVVQSDIQSINSGSYCKVSTSEGGANGTGLNIEISGSDQIVASIEDMKTKIMVENTVQGGTLPYTIADNA